MKRGAQVVQSHLRQRLSTLNQRFCHSVRCPPVVRTIVHGSPGVAGSHRSIVVERLVLQLPLAVVQQVVERLAVDMFAEQVVEPQVVDRIAEQVEPELALLAG